MKGLLPAQKPREEADLKDTNVKAKDSNSLATRKHQLNWSGKLK